MVSFYDFIKDFDLADGDKLDSDEIYCTERKKPDRNEGSTIWSFENKMLKNVNNEKEICISEKENIITYLQNKNDLSKGLLIVSGMDKSGDGLYQIILSNFAVSKNNKN